MTNQEYLEAEEREILAAHAREKRVKKLLCNKYRNVYGACIGCPFGKFIDGAEKEPWRCMATPRAILDWADQEAKA